MTKRVSITLLYDRDGIVDDYMIYFMQSMAPFMERMIVMSNGKLDPASKEKLKAVTSEIIERENTNFDVGAYKEGLSYIGYENLAQYDELLLYNYTNFGPIFPFSEMFSEMEKRKDDFWGISIYNEEKAIYKNKNIIIPEHINSFFLAIRKPILSSPEFKKYWDNVGPITSYEDCIMLFEVKFTQHFHELGFSYSAYISSDKYEINYALFNQVDKVIQDRAPVLKRRLFFNDPFHNIEVSIDLRKTLDEIQKNSDHDLGLIWKNITRTTDAFTYNANCVNTSILDDNVQNKALAKKKIAVIVHISNENCIKLFLDYYDLIKDYDLFITITPVLNDNLKNHIDLSKNKKVKIILADDVLTTNTFHFIDVYQKYIKNNGYDFVSRINFDLNNFPKHDDDLVFHDYFTNEYTLRNMFLDKNYINTTLHMLNEDKNIGIMTPSVCHDTGIFWYLKWDKNKVAVKDILKKMNISVPVYDDIAVAPYFGSFWFKPEALKTFFDYDWSQEQFQFNENTKVAHFSAAVELTISYCAQSLGFLTHYIMNKNDAEMNYNALEYKYQTLLGASPYKNVKMMRDYLHGDDIGLKTRQARRELQKAFKYYFTALYRSFLGRFTKKK